MRAIYIVTLYTRSQKSVRFSVKLVIYTDSMGIVDVEAPIRYIHVQENHKTAEENLCIYICIYK